MKYLVVIEKGSKSYGAYVPDLPGCVAVAKTAAQVRKLIRDAIDLHLDDMRQQGEKPPKPTTSSEYVDAA